MYYIGIDPGGTTGVALVWFRPGLTPTTTTYPTLTAFWQLPYDIAIQSLAEICKEYDTQLGRIICEEYKLFKHKALQQSGSKMEAAKISGALEYISYAEDIPMIYQSPQIKTLGENIAKVIEKETPISWSNRGHARDAWWHVLAYLVRNNLLEVGE